jgi:hypothetical protein
VTERGEIHVIRGGRSMKLLHGGFGLGILGAIASVALVEPYVVVHAHVCWSLLQYLELLIIHVPPICLIKLKKI